MNTDLIARLAAANPVPAPQRAGHPRRRYVLVLAAAALLVPAAYGADRLLGIGNEGTSVPTSSVLPGQSRLDQALREMQVGDTMQELGTVNGVRIYAARNAGGHICLAVDHVAETYEKGVLCELDDPGFPDGTKVLTFPGQLQGIAADGVARLEVVDAQGTVVDSTTVTNNLFASSVRFRPPVAPADFGRWHVESAAPLYVVALDAKGDLVAKQKLPG